MLPIKSITVLLISTFFMLPSLAREAKLYQSTEYQIQEEDWDIDGEWEWTYKLFKTFEEEIKDIERQSKLIEFNVSQEYQIYCLACNPDIEPDWTSSLREGEGNFCSEECRKICESKPVGNKIKAIEEDEDWQLYE